MSISSPQLYSVLYLHFAKYTNVNLYLNARLHVFNVNCQIYLHHENQEQSIKYNDIAG